MKRGVLAAGMQSRPFGPYDHRIYRYVCPAADCDYASPWADWRECFAYGLTHLEQVHRWHWRRGIPAA